MEPLTPRNDGEIPFWQRMFRHKKVRLAIATIALLLAVGFLPGIVRWQHIAEQQAIALSNIRRVGQGALLYAQDWDARTPPPPYEDANRVYETWPLLLRQYVSPESSLSNPSNPVLPFRSSLRDPFRDFPVDSSFSINGRLWNQFGAGPFPIDNIELPDETVLFVEGGRMSRVARRFQPGRTVAYLTYGDTTDQLGTYFPYPSTHNGQMAVVAADGHGVLLNVAHYTGRDGLHDRLYGRIGAGIYNWNGGHPNGETDRPPKE